MAFLGGIGKFLLGFLAEFFWKKISAWLSGRLKKKADESNAKHNEAKLDESLKTGKDEDIEKASENLLNGRS
jgi:hypothetical protein